MPYWTYNKVRERLKSPPWVIDSPIKEFSTKVKSRVVAETKERKWVERFFSDPLHVLDEMERVSLGILDDCPTEMAEGDRTGFCHGFKLSLTDHVQSCAVQKVFKGVEPLRFFLEPTIAKAFATTEIKGLVVEDLPDLPIPFAIYFPDGLVPDTGKRPGTIERSVHELYLLALSEEYPPERTKGAPSRNLFFAQKNRDMSGQTFFEMQMVGLGKGANLDELIKGVGGTAWEDIADSPTRDMFSSKEEPGPSMMMRVLVNTLLYWKSVDPDILRQINPDYDKTQKRMSRARGKKRDRIKKSLRSVPRHEHSIVGRNLEVLQRRRCREADLSGQTDRSAGGGSPKAWHWTKGHWRWQRCGKGLSERKLIFIDPYWSGTLPPVEKLGYDVRS